MMAPYKQALAASIPSLTIDGIQCDTEEHSNFHIHLHLDIFIDGREIRIPNNIGSVPDKCTYGIHTDDNSGIIHIESPEKRTFWLGELFHIWGRNFNNTQLFDNKVEEHTSNKGLYVYINGQKVASGVDYRLIPLKAHDEIAIIYGVLPTFLPSGYDFPKGL
jgi:hypothetical protein